jgi:hypothetical protein
MKKIFIMFIMTVFVGLSFVSPFGNSETRTKLISNTVNKPPVVSNEDLYHDIFISLLMPYIDRAIEYFYDDYLTYLPGEDPWSVIILDIERPQSFQFVIKLEVVPYVGPHNSVGIDHITFRVNASGKVEMEKFEHVKSFDIAPNYKSIIKKWPPE